MSGGYYEAGGSFLKLGLVEAFLVHPPPPSPPASCAHEAKQHTWVSSCYYAVSAVYIFRFPDLYAASTTHVVTAAASEATHNVCSCFSHQLDALRLVDKCTTASCRTRCTATKAGNV